MGFGDTLPLARLLKAFFSGGTPLTSEESFWQGDLPWVSPKDFGGGFHLTDASDHISPAALAGSSAKKVAPGDILMVVRSGVLAHTLPIAVAAREMAINQDLKALVPNKLVRPDYLAAFLQAFGPDILPIVMKHGVTVQSVNTPELLSLPVSVPAFVVQDDVAALWIDAHRRRADGLAKAAALLASIDDLLFAELGIDLPPEIENSLASRIFKVPFHRVSGWRFDASFHQQKFEVLVEALARSPFTKESLGKLSASIVGGATPTRGDENLYCEDGIRFLRIMNVRTNRIKLDDVKYIQDHVHNVDLRRSRLQADDVLVTITGRVGTSAVVTTDMLPANINQHIVRLRITRKDVLPEYVAIYLNSRVGLTLSNRGVTGGTRIALDYAAIKRLPVPLPDQLEQRRIVEQVREVQDKAYRLEEQANAELAAARARIEVMLTGEAA